METGVTKVKNPKTGRIIAVGKGVYNDLIREGYVLQGGKLVLPPGVVPLREKPTGDLMATLLSPMAELQVQPFVQPLPQHQPVMPPIAQITIPTGVVAAPVQLQPVTPVIQSITQPTPRPHPITQPTPRPHPITQPTPRMKSPSPVRSPQQVVVTVPGYVPDPTLFRMEVQMIEQQEDEERTRLCKACDEFYISRTRNLLLFRKEDYGTLQKIVPICERCSELCDAKVIRKGFDPRSNPECQKYKNAAISSRKRLSEIEAELRGTAINLAQFTGQDIGKFFPTTPTHELR